MTRTSPILWAAMFLVLTGLGWSDARFRADSDSSLTWFDNPALPAAADELLGLGVVSPYSYENSQLWMNLGGSVLRATTVNGRVNWDGILGLGPWQGLSLGAATDGSRWDAGLVYRPWDTLSLGITADRVQSPSTSPWGLGLGLRPLNWWRSGQDWLTLTADGRWNQGTWTWEEWGARATWNALSAGVWWDPENQKPGWEISLTINGLEAAARQNRSTLSYRLKSPNGTATVLGKSYLRLEGPGQLAGTPAAPDLWTGNAILDVLTLADLLNRAADATEIQAVVIFNPPSIPGLASGQTLAQAVEHLHESGKKLYVFADSLDDSMAITTWIASADRIVLDPNGTVMVTAGTSRRLYWKGLFDNLGIRFFNYAPWATKSANNPLTFASMPTAERDMMERILRDREDQRRIALADGRGQRLGSDPATILAEGPYLVAQKAKDAGLVDDLLNRSDFEQWLHQSLPSVQPVNQLASASESKWGPQARVVKVPLVYLSGSILPGPGIRGQSIGSAAVHTLESLRQDSSVKGIVLFVDSPGGAVLPSDALADQVRKTVAAGKPVLVVMGDVAASGGYYLAAPATRIWARPGTTTGSIGVTAAVFEISGALAKLAIGADGIDLAASSSFGDVTRPPSPQEQAQWQDLIQSAYQRFLGVVSDGRHLDRKKLEDLAQGQVYTGREALQLGLVDAMGGLGEAKEWLEDQWNEPVEWQEIWPGEAVAWTSLLSKTLGETLVESDTPALRISSRLATLAQPDLAELDGILSRGPGVQAWYPGD